MHKILLIEDDLRVARSIQQILSPNHYFVTHTRSIEEAYSFLSVNRPHLIVADRALPDGDSVEIIEYLASIEAVFPILVLSEKGLIEDRILGLEKGADDYLAKPFSTTELLLRMKKLLTKTKITDAQVLKAGYVSVFPQKGLVRVRDREVILRKKELQIFAFLIRHKNTVISRERIISNLWGEDAMPDITTIDVYIRRIRTLLGTHEKIIQTVRGYGYVIKDG